MPGSFVASFTHVLESGDEGSVHLDQVLEYNEDPTYLRDHLVYKLTVEARQRFKEISHYHRYRCHQPLEMDCPAPRPVQPPEVGAVVEIRSLETEEAICRSVPIRLHASSG